MFDFIKKVFRRFFAEEDAEDDYYDDEESQVLSRDRINIDDRDQRENYVKNCIDQMNDARFVIEDLEREYSMITAYLTDMEEIESLPFKAKKEIVEVAEKITAYEKEKNIREEARVSMPDREFFRMQAMEKDVVDIINQLREVEDYQEKIRMDLRRLSGERHAYQYRKHDLSILMVNLRGMLIITVFAFITCMAILMILKTSLKMDIQAGYILTAIATVASVSFIFYKYHDSQREKKNIEGGIKRLISLQNKVKIRYVNNTNLLDFLYIKHNVSSGKELEDMWNRYLVDREERLKLQELYAELEYYHKELLKLLRALPIKHPHIWINQCYALGKKGEMVEIRHSLILRRQKLRDQMDKSEKLAKKAQDEVRALIEEYPQYKPQIVEQLSQSKAEQDRLRGMPNED